MIRNSIKIFLLLFVWECLWSLAGVCAEHDVDLFFVIDNSGSMRKNDPNFIALHTVREFLERLPPETRVGIVMFDQKATLLEPLGAMSDPIIKQNILTSLDRIGYKGQFTNSAAGIERALYELKAAGREDASKCIIFLTDGIVDTGQRQQDIELTQWLKNDLTSASRRAGVRIFGIAFTDDADFILIQALAARTDGAYYRVYTPEHIAGVLEEVQKLLLPPPISSMATLSIAEPDKKGGGTIQQHRPLTPRKSRHPSRRRK